MSHSTYMSPSARKRRAGSVSSYQTGPSNAAGAFDGNEIFETPPDRLYGSLKEGSSPHLLAREPTRSFYTSSYRGSPGTRATLRWLRPEILTASQLPLIAHRMHEMFVRTLPSWHRMPSPTKLRYAALLPQAERVPARRLSWIPTSINPVIATTALHPATSTIFDTIRFSKSLSL